MDEEKVKKWVHDLNNRVAVVLSNAEMMQIQQIEKLPPKSLERAKMIEEKALEIRQLIVELREHLLPEKKGGN